jgi:hypothetical protein
MYIQKRVNEGKNMKRTNDVSLGAVHTHTHTHTPGILANKKIINRIDTIKKDSKGLVLIDNT